MVTDNSFSNGTTSTNNSSGIGSGSATGSGNETTNNSGSGNGSGNDNSGCHSNEESNGGGWTTDPAVSRIKDDGKIKEGIKGLGVRGGSETIKNKYTIMTDDKKENNVLSSVACEVTLKSVPMSTCRVPVASPEDNNSHAAYSHSKTYSQQKNILTKKRK